MDFIMAAKLCLCTSTMSTKRRHCSRSSKHRSSANLIQRHKRDLTLMDCCRWLIAAGFPQYVQLFAENQLKKSDVETLADDHRDIETSLLQVVETRLNLLLRFAQSKSTNAGAQCSTTGNTTAPTGVTCSTAHSRHWHYDRLCRRWLRSANSTSGSSYPTLTSGLRPLLLRRRSTTGSSSCRPRPLDSPSPSLADTGNHVTSGYESENSPTSTATRTDACPPTSPSDSSPSSVCSCTSTSSSSAGTGFVVDADDPVVDEQGRRRRTATTAVSPVLEVYTCRSPLRTSCSGRIALNGVSGVLEGRHHVTSPCSPTTSPSSTSNGFTDGSRSVRDDSTILAGYHLGNSSADPFSDSTMLNGFAEVPASASSPQIRPGLVTVSSTPAVQAAGGRHGRGGSGMEKRPGAAVRSRSSCADPERPPRSSSFYDNLSVSEVLADPQAELELILDDLRRNISALDAALGTSPSAEQSPCSPLSVATETETSIVSGASSSSSSGQLRVYTSTTGVQPSGTTPSDAPSPAASLDSGCVVVMETNTRTVTSASRQDSADSKGISKQHNSRTDMKNGHHSLPLHTDRPRDRKSQRSSGVNDWWLERAAPRDVADDVKSVTSLSACELGIVRQLCLMDLTVQFEKHCSNRQTSTDTINRLASMFSMTSQPTVGEQRNKDGGVTQNRVFGAVVGDQLRRSGRAVPRCISRAMKLVLDQADDADGVFRRPGVASRVQKLQDDMGREPDAVEFDGESDVYSVADVIKRYFRDMPESVLTDKLSNILVDLFTYLPEKLQWTCVQSAFLLLPDANRSAACELLVFLHGVAQHTVHNQMNASNLAVCFLPSLFRINDYHQMAAPSPAPPNNSSSGSGRESNQNRYKSAVTCLRVMIENAPSLTQVPDRILPALRNYDKDGGDILRTEQQYSVSVSTYLQRLFDELRVNAADETYHGVNDWISCDLSKDVNPVDGHAADHIISVSRRSTLDEDCGLHVWRVTVDIGAPPVEVLDRLRQSATDWDPAVQRWNVLEQLGNNVDLVEFSLTLPQLERRRHFRVVRSWRSDQSTGRCMLVSTSVASDVSFCSNSRQLDSSSSNGDVEGRILVDHYVIEPCGTGMSRLTHVSCIDFSGHTVDWYLSAYARLCCSRVSLIRDSFRQPTKWTRGPETKV